MKRNAHKNTAHKALWLIPLICLTFVSCRSETQNKLRRQVQDITGGTQYISLYSLGGTVVFSGKVDGKVTRADSADGGQGEYVYWYDDKGRYNQSNLTYLLTNYDRGATATP